MSVLIAYATIEGQTGKIARFVENLVQEAGEEPILYDTSSIDEEASFDGVTSVILAASVHERRHPQVFEVFVTAKSEALEERRTLFLSVSMSAAFPDGMEEAQDYVDEMKMRTQFEPDEELLVAGAIKAHHYDYYATQVLRHVVLRGRNFDPTVQEHEFTDWDAVAETVTAFLENVHA